MAHAHAAEAGSSGGIAAALGAGVCLATGGIGLRLVEQADGWQVLAYRGAALALAVFAWSVYRYRSGTWRAFRDVGTRGMLAAVAIGFTAVFYVFAILNTSVANTVVILSLSPLVAAAVAWVVLREAVSRSTWMALGIAVLGVSIMCADGVQAGGLAGIVIAFGAVLCFSVFVVMVRAGRNVDMIPAIAMSGLVSAAIGAAMSDTLAVSYRDGGIGIFLGVVQLGLGYALITLATRRIPAALVALLTMSELVFAPLFVWVGVGEIPTVVAGFGGLVVASAVFYQAWRAL